MDLLAHAILTPTLAGVEGEEIGMVAVTGGIIFLMLRTIFGQFTKMHRTRTTEETRREVAAYVAEGSITTDEAERILNAGKPRSSCSTRT
ncbi:MAG: hypothetical protein AAGK04_05155 [Planctomycetota bacterium]